ncbi:hypothetical protein [Shewanella sp. UCD-KL12]|uniref:hypothetical protein n=1 Tax=Shewanella sp. UCD-KL12 TaxID=1917163 RepID=UPI0009705D57|nr:hypothetical protein [Shewanella sp. UCD-KL12]
MNKKYQSPSVIDDTIYINSDDIIEYSGQKNVSSRVFNPFFCINKRVPKCLMDKIKSQDVDDLEKIIFGESPLLSKKIELAYWDKSETIDFDEMRVDLYGSVGLADDRSVLDGIIAKGDQIVTKGKTIRLGDVFEFLDIDVSDIYTKQQLSKPLLNRGTYYHITTSDLFKHLNMELQTKNRKMIRTRIDRLSKMLFRITKFREGIELPNPENRQFIYPEEQYFILDKNKLKNKNNFTADTYTNILVCVNDDYVKDLDSDGFLTRTRLLQVYHDFNSINGLPDFLKYLDSNKRSFIHTKKLSWLIDRYLGSKTEESMQGLNLYHTKKKLTDVIIKNAPKIFEHFQLRLEVLINDDSKKVDYQFFHAPGDSN